MPKRLQQPPPTSAVARLLNREVANRAVAPIRDEPIELPVVASPDVPAVPAEPLPENVPRIKREFILSDEADGTFNDLLLLFRRATHTRLTASQLFRSILKALRQTLPVLQYEAKQLGRMRLPGNGREATRQRQEFERRLSEALAAAFRTAATIQASAQEAAPARDRPGR